MQDADERNSHTATLFHLPGWYWFLEDEKNINELNDEARNYLITVCERIMYREFRIMGYHEFATKAIHILHAVNEPYIKYYYNRQIIIQLTQHPLSTSEVHVTIPLRRETNTNANIQMDILKLNQHFYNINYHVRYLVVAVDIFSRFVWVHPVQELKVNNVTNALLRAFSRPGISKDYFDSIRDFVTVVDVDGGSEFKKDFPTSMKGIFPNSEFVISLPKSQTLGRPTTTGPIEAAIRMLRKLLRDYGLSRQANILDEQDTETRKSQAGLSDIIDSYNDMKRSVLRGLSPTEVALERVKLGENSEGLVQHMRDIRKKQLLKRSNMRTKEFPLIRTNHEDCVYRLYLQQGVFPKEVDFRCSLETYYIEDYNSHQVKLKNTENDETRMTSWLQLVLVKKPMPNPPHKEKLIKFFKQTEKQNHVEMAPHALMEPYEISDTIREAMGDHVVLNAHPGRVLRRSERIRRLNEEKE